MDNSTTKYSPEEHLLSNMVFLEQFAETVLEYSSKYNSVMSIYYAPENIPGKPARYPNYGDFPDTYILRTYGKWWNESEFAQEYYMPQDKDAIISEDFITVGFDAAVIPKNVIIYETFNPGAIVRIWARMTGCTWKILYEAPPENVNQNSVRKFMPPINKINETINQIRLELNQSKLRYHTALDAVLLVGYKPNSALEVELLKRGIYGISPQKDVDRKPSTPIEHVQTDSVDYVSQLPYEVLIHIFSYMDLKTLLCCARVNKTWNQTTKDSSLYNEINLKKYWSRVTNETLSYLRRRCTRLKKLDISWCINGYVTEEYFIKFLKHTGQHLTHLSCQFCKFVKDDAIKQIGCLNNLIELRLRTCYPHRDYRPIANLKKLLCLDLHSTNIDDKQLILILKENPNLRHLNIDFCEAIKSLEDVAEVVASYNKAIITWSSWRTHTMTSLGVMHLARCKNLKELDLGWCLVFSHPDHCLEKIAQGCPNLRRLILCGWRGVSDNLLMPIVQNCRNLEQLDLLGIKNITGEVCEMALSILHNFKLLDISFCDSIEEEKVRMWRKHFPSVLIQRSCEFGHR